MKSTFLADMALCGCVCVCVCVRLCVRVCVCILQGFGGALAVIPFMGLLESIAIAKAFGKCFIHTHGIVSPSH